MFIIILVTILLTLLVAVVIACVGGAILMWLWNWVIVGLFDAPQLSYAMALGINLLLNFIAAIFRSFYQTK